MKREMIAALRHMLKSDSLLDELCVVESPIAAKNAKRNPTKAAYRQCKRELDIIEIKAVKKVKKEIVML